jgi:hypothetical protein
MKTVNALISDRGQREDRKERPLLRRVRHLRVSRPDIATQVRFRKEEEMVKGADKLRADGFDRRGQDPHQLPVLPAGPVALQRRFRHHRRLHRGRDRAHLLGENWMPDYVKRANDGGIERVLVYDVRPVQTAGAPLAPPWSGATSAVGGAGGRAELSRLSCAWCGMRTSRK